METAALLDFAYPLPASRLSATGDLRLRQRSLTPDRSTWINEDGVVFNSSSLDVDNWTWDGLVDGYMSRQMRTDVEVPYPVWRTGRGPNDAFVISGTIRYVEDRIYYRPAVLETLKHGWIQYLSVLLPVLAIALPFTGFLIRNQFITTRCSVDRMPSTVAQRGPKLHYF